MKSVQTDKSGGLGHCWVDVDADELPATIREEIEAEQLEGWAVPCEGYIASNGQHYRW